MDSVRSVDYECRQRFIRSALVKRSQIRQNFLSSHNTCVAYRETNAQTEQTPVDIVLHGLRISRRLHVPTRFTSEPAESKSGDATLRTVLSKIHASILSAILEPSECSVLEFTEEQIARVREEACRTYSAGERHLTLLAGVIALIGDRVYDGSLRSRLTELVNALMPN